MTLDTDTQDKVLGLYSTEGLIVRAPSSHNVFRITNCYDGKKSIDYEFNEALKDPRGISSTFIIKNIPIHAYAGNHFYFIYDPNKVDVILATTTDASVSKGGEDERSINEKGKPIALGNGSTDYSRYKGEPLSIQGIRNKLYRINQKRTGDTISSSFYRGIDSLGHNELLIRIKQNVEIEDAIIGIAIKKSKCSRFLGSREHCHITQSYPTTKFYLYDPVEGLEILSKDNIFSLESMLDDLRHNQLTLPLGIQLDARSIRKIGNGGLIEKQYRLLYLLMLSLEEHNEKFSKLPDRLESLPEKIDIIFPDDFIKFKNDITLINNCAENEIQYLEYYFLSRIYLTRLFLKRIDVYNPRKADDYKVVDFLEGVKIEKTVDNKRMAVFLIENQNISYFGKQLEMTITVAMIDGITRLYGTVDGIGYSHNSHDILCHSLGFYGDGGALFFLQKKYDERLRDQNMSELGFTSIEIIEFVEKDSSFIEKDKSSGEKKLSINDDVTIVEVVVQDEEKKNKEIELHSILLSSAEKSTTTFTNDVEEIENIAVKNLEENQSQEKRNDNVHYHEAKKEVIELGNKTITIEEQETSNVEENQLQTNPHHQLKALVKDILENKGWSQRKRFSCFESRNKPTGIRNLSKKLNSLLSTEEALDEVIKKAKWKHSGRKMKKCQWFFRGRHDDTNELYGIIGKIELNQESSITAAMDELNQFKTKF